MTCSSVGVVCSSVSVISFWYMVFQVPSDGHKSKRKRPRSGEKKGI